MLDLHTTHLVPIDGPLLRSELDELLASLPDRFPGEHIARAKAVVEVEASQLVLAQVVGTRVEVTPLFDTERQPATDLVVITVGV